jgi:hypothetical protein
MMLDMAGRIQNTNLSGTKAPDARDLDGLFASVGLDGDSKR